VSSTGFVPLSNNFGEQARRLANAALDLLFPPRCAVCRRVGSLLCQVCISDFVPVVGPVCQVCGEPQSTANLCARCTVQPRAFSSVRSGFAYSGTIRPAIHALKYNHKPGLAKPLAEALSRAITRTPSPDEYLCAVPLYSEREIARGYNQSKLLAHSLGAIWEIPVIAADAFCRMRNTTSQVELDYSARQANVEGAFKADPTLIEGHAILLIDDVCTTGATLHACAVALLAAGATSVNAITLARAV